MFNFDLTNGYVLLRLMCGAFLVPHAIAKVKHRAPVVGFFTAAGLQPVKLWVGSAMVVEWVLAAAMILGVLTPVAAVATGVFMLVATFANHRVCKGKWLWNLGGSEYPLFWGLCCFIVAWAAYQGLV